MILDVGSGHNPHPSANVLCDLFIIDSQHRGGHCLNTSGKPFVCADVEYLPFKPGIFSFVIASHVLEHTKNPQRALMELKRVGMHGQARFPTRLGELLLHPPQVCGNPHLWILKPKSNKINAKIQTIKPTRHIFQTLQRVTHSFWRRNYRIRLRKRIWMFIRPIYEHIINW